MVRFRVEVYGRRKLESGEWGRVMVKQFIVWCSNDGYDITTREPYIPITSQDHSIAAQVRHEHTTILTERFFHRPLTEYRVTLEP